jgi:peptidoglycan/xylan/chitin deacetylase (PgdA/CDA1 family)
MEPNDVVGQGMHRCSRDLSGSGSSGVRLLAWLLRYPSRRIPRILVYHRFGDEERSITREGFDRQLRFLKEHCNVVHLSRLVAALRGVDSVPTNSVVLTVDDGYADFYRIAFPLLRRYEIPCTFFVTTNFVGGREWLWPDKVAWMLTRRDRFPDLHVAGHIVLGGDRAAAPRLRAEILALLQMVDFDELECELRQVARQLELEFPRQPVAGYQACSWDQLREMETSGLVEVGGHTRSHVILSRLAPVRLPTEIDGCLEDLEANLGSRARSFCYPNGKPGDYSDAVRDAIARSGFVSACAAFYDRKHLDDRYALRRFSSSEDFVHFFKAASGLQYWGARLLGRNNIDVRD